MDILIFFYFASIIVVTATLVVALRNPIFSVLSLLVMFFHVAGLYVTLHAEFLAAIQIIVYAGAILIFYLFVMLLNVKRELRLHRQSLVAFCLGVTLLTEAILLVLQSKGPLFPAAASVEPAGDVTGNTESIGQVLYSTYLFPFEVASLILLVAMVGAVVLSKKGLLNQKSS